MTEQEAVERVGKALGLTFKHNDFLEQWESKVGCVTLDASYDRYSTVGDMENADGGLFLAVGYSNRKTKAGAGAPTDTLEEAIAWFRRRLHGDD